MKQVGLLVALVVGLGAGQVPSSWTCSREYYDAVDGCDCHCGAWDPDCDNMAFNSALYCENGEQDTAGRQCDRGTLTCVSGTPAPTPGPTAKPTAAPGSLFDLRVSENLAAHRTGKFYSTAGFEPTDVLVLRRGQGFVVRAPAGRSGAGAPSVELGGSALSVGAVAGGDGRTWRATIPGTFGVGRRTLTIDGTGHGTVTVLFNPYEAEDTQTYVGSAEDRAEYVENEYGRYWYGDVYSEGLNGAGSSEWAFGQYDVLNYVAELVEHVGEGRRGDARLVARDLTYLLNTATAGLEHGVLYGRWDGKYSDGTEPWVWTGSRAILKQWSEAGQRPVRYGQCWVFACLLTTVLRTLGIAARPVTNFRSAHEVKPFNFVVEESKGDSIWNFHAWVDAMLARDDLGTVGGQSFGDVQWNAVDATPQETSGGRYQMGPAALRVMRTNVDHSKAYDTRFVVSEVNAAVLRNGVRIHDDVGRYVSTKRRGCDGAGHACREDITSQYKAYRDPWATSARGVGALGAAGAAGDDKRLMTPRRYDELAGFSLGARGLEVGGDVEFFVRALGPMGLSGGPGGATASFRVEVVSYTGVLIAELGERAGVASPDGRAATIRVGEGEYAEFLGRAGTVRVAVEVRNMVGLLVYSHTHKFELVYPRLEVVSTRGNEVVVRVHNPLATPVTHGKLAYSTPAADHVRKVGTVPAGGELTVALTGEWCNREHQPKKVVLSFSAKELGGNGMHADAPIVC